MLSSLRRWGSRQVSLAQGCGAQQKQGQCWSPRISAFTAGLCPHRVPVLVPAHVHNAMTWISEAPQAGGTGMSKSRGSTVYWKPASTRMPHGRMWQPGQT